MGKQLQLQQNKCTLLTQRREPQEEEELWTNTDRVLYGPVASRRLGESIGINLFPDRKICSYNCVYCDVGLSKYNNKKYVEFEKISQLFEDQIIPIKEKFQNDLIKIDYFTFCGNGEDLDHPDFEKIYYFIRDILNELFPEIPTAILTNGANLANPKNIKIINEMDVNFIKLDAGDEKTFLRINRPQNHNIWELLINNLKYIKNLRLETAIVDSEKYSNLASLHSNYIDLIHIYEKLENLKEIYLHNIDYPTPDKNIRLIGIEELEELADFIAKKVKIPVYVLCSRVNFRER